MTILNKSQVKDIALSLKNGKAVVLPTDTVWGIVSQSQELIYQIKQRPREKKIAMFISSLDEINISSFFKNVLKQYMPGALSIIHNDISYRIPNCQYLIDLIKITGPLYQSSANISGQQPIVSLQQAQEVFKKNESDIVFIEQDGQIPINNKPSTIVNLDTLQLVRQGALDGTEILNKLKERKA